MSINFDIERIEISKFRGIPELSVNIVNNAPNFLIGSNNSGKSTIINAIALSLKAAYFYRFIPSIFDFFRKSDDSYSKEFHIRLIFSAKKNRNLPAVQGVGNPILVKGIHVKGTINKDGYAEHKHILLNENLEKITYSDKTPLKGEVKDKFKNHGLGYHPKYAKLEDIKSHLPEVWLLTPENLNRSLYEWKTGPLQMLSRILTEKFLHDEWTLTYNKKERKMPDTMYEVHEFFKNTVEKLPFWTNELQPKLNKTLSQYLGHQTSINLKPDVQTIEEWIKQQLVASFASCEGSANTPLSSMGDGWQSLVRMAALEVLCEFSENIDKKVFLLFEEPETYLHPHLKRKLRNVFERLSKLNWTIICSTHSSEFIDFSGHQNLIRLSRTPSGLKDGAILTDNISEGLKFQEKLDERGNHELLFANKIILCEGKDDLYAVKLLFSKKKIDTDAHSITVIDIGGISNMCSYASMASKLNIAWSSITDEDVLDDGSINPKTKEIRDKLSSIKSKNDLGTLWLGNLEKCLGIKNDKKATPEWQRRNLEPKSLKQIEKDFPEFVKSVQTLLEWINK